MSSPNEPYKNLSFTTLSSLEFEALNSLDESIRYHETNVVDENVQSCKELKRNDEKLGNNDVMLQEPSNQATAIRLPGKLNAGFILFDGAEIKYISNDSTDTETLSKPPEQLNTDGSFRSKSPECSSNISDEPAYLNLSSADLVIRESFKGTNSRISLTPYKRLPTYVHFSTPQKFYFLSIGAATVLAVNAFYMNIAFLLPLLGKQVLSEIGICHHVLFLASILFTLCGKKHWVPFLPTVPICLVLMAVSVAVLPSLEAVGISLSIFAIYGVITVNGLCAGLSQSLVNRMIVLFPGGKSSLLVLHGEGIGSLLPAVVQIIFCLSLGLNSTEPQLSDSTRLCLYASFSVVFLGIITGLVSFMKLRKSGIYQLFAARDCIAHSPKNITLGSVPETARRRYHTIKWYLFVEFTLSFTSYFVLSLTPSIHEATFENPRSNAEPFWKVYLATVLIAFFRVGHYLGEILSRHCCNGQPKLNNDVAMFLYSSASILRLGFIVCAVIFIRSPFLVYNNLFIISFFFMLAFTNSFVSVAMASSCQSLIRVQRNDTCPIVSQLLRLAEVLGATFGIVLSFVQLTI